MLICLLSRVRSKSEITWSDASLACGGGGEPDVYPLAVEVYELQDGLLEKAGWKPSTVSTYSREDMA